MGLASPRCCVTSLPEPASPPTKRRSEGEVFDDPLRSSPVLHGDRRGTMQGRAGRYRAGQHGGARAGHPRATVICVTASWSFDEQPRIGDPLLPGAAPAAIRDALLPDDRAAFETAYQQALTRARDELDLTELFKVHEHWRRLALLQRDPTRFVSIARRAAERLTGVPMAEDEPLAQTRHRAGI